MWRHHRLYPKIHEWNTNHVREQQETTSRGVCWYSMEIFSCGVPSVLCRRRYTHHDRCTYWLSSPLQENDIRIPFNTFRRYINNPELFKMEALL